MISNKDQTKPTITDKENEDYASLIRLDEEDIEEAMINDVEQEVRDTIFKAIDTLRQPQDHGKPTINAIYNMLKEDLEGIDKHNPTPIEQRIRDLVKGYTELINAFSGHALSDATTQNYGSLLGWFDAIQAYVETAKNIIDEYIPEEEKQIVLEEDAPEEGKKELEQKIEYQLQEIDILLPEHEGSENFSPYGFPALVGVGTGLCITGGPRDGRPDFGYSLTHIRSGYSIPDLGRLSKLADAQRFLEKIAPLFDWNATENKINKNNPVIIERYGGMGNFKEKVLKAYREVRNEK